MRWGFDITIDKGNVMLPGQAECQAGGDGSLAGTAFSAGNCYSHRHNLFDVLLKALQFVLQA